MVHQKRLSSVVVTVVFASLRIFSHSPDSARQNVLMTQNNDFVIVDVCRSLHMRSADKPVGHIGVDDFGLL